MPADSMGLEGQSDEVPDRFQYDLFYPPTHVLPFLGPDDDEAAVQRRVIDFIDQYAPRYFHFARRHITLNLPYTVVWECLQTAGEGALLHNARQYMVRKIKNKRKNESPQDT